MDNFSFDYPKYLDSCTGKIISKIELIDDDKCWILGFSDKSSLLIDAGGGKLAVLRYYDEEGNFVEPELTVL